jgi:streptomycin 6-kinase
MWQLFDLEVVRELTINFLCYAKSRHGDVVLKIAGPHSERQTEMVALKLYNGRYTCRCVEIDFELGAMLLERIKPGDCLRNSVPEDDQLRIGSRLVRDLPIPVKGDVPLPSYNDWIERAYSVVNTQYEPSECFRRSMQAAKQLFSEIYNCGRYLLHGDLHHDNILLDAGDNWKVIDPQGVIGAPVMECGRFVQNHAVNNENELDMEKVVSIIDYMATVLGKPKRDIWIAFFVLHVLSFCWGFEMNYRSEILKRGSDECAVIRDVIKA